MTDLAVVIMAAGKGTRMNNPLKAKVMFEINGKPLVHHVVDLAERLEAVEIVVIVGWQKDSVIDHMKEAGKKVTCVEQNPQLGTGHAVAQAEPVLKEFNGNVLVLSGDVPMLSYETTRDLINQHEVKSAAATVLTAVIPNATGYGRILRDMKGNIVGIVEHKDATDAQRKINEINSGIYVFQSVPLFEALRSITPENSQKEYYLTDVFEQFWKKGHMVGAVKARDPKEIQGINTPEHLEEARALMPE